MTTTQKIYNQEIKGRFIGSKCLNKMFGGRDLKIQPTAIKESVDLKCNAYGKSGKRANFNVEVKERYKNQENLKKYPYAELKVDKLNRMRKATPQGTKLFYMVLLNAKEMLLFDIDKIDFSKVKIFNWWTKKCQEDENSELIETPIYQIPYKLAIKKLDITQYFEDYAIYKQR